MAAITSAVVAASAAAYAAQQQQHAHRWQREAFMPPRPPDPVRIPIESTAEILRQNKPGLYWLAALIIVGGYGLLSLFGVVPVI